MLFANRGLRLAIKLFVETGLRLKKSGGYFERFNRDHATARDFRSSKKENPQKQRNNALTLTHVQTQHK